MTGPAAAGSTAARSRAGGDPLEGSERPVDLGLRVVVDEPKPEHASCFGLAQPLDETGRVEVAVPGIDPVASEGLRGFTWGHAIDGDGDRGHARVEPRGIGDAVDGHAEDRLEPID